MKVKKKYPVKCSSKRCRRVVMNACRHSDKCDRCRWKAWKEANPLAYHFGNLRRRARERGKDFTLTLDQFKEFAEKTDYMRMKGKTSLSLSIDRKENSHGYHHWNIQAITLRENSRKRFTNMPKWMREEARLAEQGQPA
jgi:hypothetical protein